MSEASGVPKRRKRALLVLAVVLAVFSLVIPVGIALVVRSGGMELFTIPSGSMYPTVHQREQVWVNKFVYGPRLPFVQARLYEREPVRAGEVVVFPWPRDPSRDFLSRVIAVAGQRVRVHPDTGVVEVNGQALAHCALGAWPIDASAGIASADYRGYVERLGSVSHVILLRAERSEPADTAEMPHCVRSECTVPAGHVFTMGDHRDNSFDGRYWGFVPVASVRGRASTLFVTGDPARRGLDVHARPWVPAELREGLERCLSGAPAW